MAAKKQNEPTAIREKLRLAVEDSGLTQQQIGEAMGLGEKDARKAVSRLLNINNDYDPRLSTLLKLAKAIGRPLKDLI